MCLVLVYALLKPDMSMTLFWGCFDTCCLCLFIYKIQTTFFFNATSIVSVVSSCSVKMYMFCWKLVLRNCCSLWWWFFANIFIFLLLFSCLANVFTSKLVQLEHAHPVMARFDRLLVRLEVKHFNFSYPIHCSSFLAFLIFCFQIGHFFRIYY